MPLDAANILSAGSAITKSGVVSATLSDGWNAVIGDRVAAWRLTNAARLQVKVRAELEARNLTLNSEKIPERYAISWFEYATRTDDDEILEIFAKLLARAAEGDDESRQVYLLEIVSRMTPEDAKVFNFIARYESGDLADLRKHEWDEGTLFDNLKEGLGEYFVGSIERMVAIGLLDHKTSIDLDALNSFIFDRESGDGQALLSSIDSSEIITQTFFFTEAAITLSGCIVKNDPAEEAPSN